MVHPTPNYISMAFAPSQAKARRAAFLHRLARIATWAAVGAFLSAMVTARLFKSAGCTVALAILVIFALATVVAGVAAILIFPGIFWNERARRQARNLSFFLWSLHRGFAFISRRIIHGEARPLPVNRRAAWAEYDLEGPGNPIVRRQRNRRWAKWLAKACLCYVGIFAFLAFVRWTMTT